MRRVILLILSLTTAAFAFLFLSFTITSAQQIDCEPIVGNCQPVAGQLSCEDQGLVTPECPPYNNCCEAQNAAEPPTCNDIACLAPGDPTPTPNLPLRCPNNYECVNDPDCDGTFDSQRDCSDSQGNVGNCCQSLGSLDNPCAIMGGSCRSSGVCNWNETEEYLTCSGYPQGTVCCVEAPVIASCPPLNTSGGTCRNNCQLDECEYSQINECMEAGQECCLSETVAIGCGRVPPQKIFCDANGNPTKDPVDAQGNPRRIYTAIGCIPSYSSSSFLVTVLPWFMWIGSGISLLVIIYAGFLLLTSGGDPKRAQAGKNLLTAAITGLLLIVLSAFILRVIGVDILQIPEFGI